ncbi:MAG: putative sugar nucleotidyl transferase [Thermofilaceae archaeon]|nr:putative sugar nucleotidyl transferase [Thermofilaceae archaeon]MDW8003438.1 putative sugar nucleotidyl transferase [Thermofilaceae archaeon]
MRVCVFEDEKATNFYPLTLTRAVYELRVGISTILEKLLDAFGQGVEVSLSARDYLTDVLRERYPCYQVNTLPFDDTLFLNGRLIHMGEDVDVRDEYVGVCDGEVAFIKAKRKTLEKLGKLPIPEYLKKLSEELGRENVKAKIVNWPWDLIFENPEAIKRDFARLGKKGIYGKVKSRVEVLGEKEDVYIASTAVVYPNVVIDAENGPVAVLDGARVYPFVYVEGPTSVGEGTYVMHMARLRGGITLGPVCRVGGEVEESIVHGYSNKYHDGFLGHAYVGEWVNLGALTTNSDLKNDYSEVEVYINGRPVKTGSIKVGSFIGDHAKTSIGTLLNTGAVIGVMCNVLAPDISPKYIPSFTWYVNGRLSKGPGLRRMLRTAAEAMKRRNKELTEAQTKLFNHLYELTRDEREHYIQLYQQKLERE